MIRIFLLATFGAISLFQFPLNWSHIFWGADVSMAHLSLSQSPRKHRAKLLEIPGSYQEVLTKRGRSRDGQLGKEEKKQPESRFYVFFRKSEKPSHKKS